MSDDTRIEFFVEPFEEGRPGSHVLAAVEAVEASGMVVDVAPFSNTAVGSDDQVAVAVSLLVRRARATGATRISIQITDADVAPGINVGKLHDALDQMIDQVETIYGGPLQELSRADKQAAVRMLDERGAFLLRRAIEDVADRMGVTRITIYNYLNAIRQTEDGG